MTTAEIARCHGHTGPLACQDCGTAENLHFGSWFNPAEGTSGDFLQCCGCGIKAGDPTVVHDDCEPDLDNTGDEEAPRVHVHHRDAGWVMTGAEPEGCTTNFFREQDGRPTCTDVAVWKVVEELESADGYPMLTIGFYCDADLPAEHGPRKSAA